MLLVQSPTTNIPPPDSFPDYIDPFEEISPIMSAAVAPKPLANIQSEEASRGPSPQPTHFSVPLTAINGNGHRILRSATVGYIAPEFKGKAEQIKSGELPSVLAKREQAC
jgi:glutamate dehydrogenase